MTALLQKLYDGALDAARGLTKVRILQRLGIVSAQRGLLQPWCIDGDEITLMHSQNVADTTNQESMWKPEVPNASFRGQEHPFASEHSVHGPIESLPDEPVFPAGPPTVLVTRDREAQPCFAAVITERLLEEFNDAAQAKANYEVKKELMPKLKRREDKLRQLLAEDLDTKTSNGKSENLAQVSEQRAQIQEELDKVSAKKRLWRMHIQAFEDNLSFSRKTIHRLLAEALESANLLKAIEQPKETDPGDEDDEDLIDDGETCQNRIVPEKNEVEVALETARDAYLDANEKLVNAQLEFDQKDSFAGNELYHYEIAAAEGTTEETRSQFDVAMLAHHMHLTAKLIEAEDAFNEVQNEAEAAGAFRDGWAQEYGSEYGWDYDEPQDTSLSLPTGLDPDQVDAWDFRNPIDENGRRRVGNWMGRTDESANPYRFVASAEIELDEWNAREVEIDDSPSMLDFGPRAPRIQQWHEACEQHRQERRGQDQPGSTSKSLLGSLKRRRSF